MAEQGLDQLPESPSDWINWTKNKQSLASDPQRFAWVSANAGSGKTHVLTQRVIRLLLAGARPSAILCLTYTKAAASEMSNRVLSTLSRWATLDDENLSQAIRDMEGVAPPLEKLSAARQLFARALETPGGLKIQTIHAFCEALLHQFPLEANVAGHFSVLDDRAAASLLTEARRTLLTATTTEDDRLLADAFATALSIGDDTGLERLLSEIVSTHTSLVRFHHYCDANGGAEAVLRNALGLGLNENADAIYAGMFPLAGFSEADLIAFIDLAHQKGGAKPKEVAGLLAAAFEATGADAFALVCKALLTAKQEPKAMSGIASKAMLDADPYLADKIEAAQADIVQRLDRLKTIQLYEASYAAIILARRLNGEYEELKKRRGHLDFDDLIARTADLLTRDDAGPWIHYKLDQGIDHVLVDEAQDTSPLQWAVVRSLTEEFLAGETARGQRRTLFAVGDEKQSIYSFQGARPERFSQEGRDVRSKAVGAQLAFSDIRLPLSFRSTEDVLSAVDQVFSRPDYAKGLTAEDGAVIHQSSRTGHPGAVDIWDLIVPEASVDEEDWTEPFDATPESAPPAVLARRIADKIANLLKTGEVVERDKRRAIRPNDILVLVRKRGGFAGALTRALKARDNIPVAGADRLLLTDHIAVQDLAALGRFALLPHDDLSLAALLKSPLCGVTEDELMSAAAYRKMDESLWQRVGRLASEKKAPFTALHEKLEGWIEAARWHNPFEFYEAILGPGGGRKLFISRLGSEASDILDEFLALALSFEASGLPGIQSFLSLLEMEPPTIKREQDKDRNEVRIMTVHASKGLEAPVVFVVDDGGAAFDASHLSKFRFIEPETGKRDVPLWIANGELNTALTRSDADTRKASAEDEYRRLLYVAMTRAADQLIVCGYRKQRENPDSWHNMVWQSLEADREHCQPDEFSYGAEQWSGLKWRAKGVKRQLLLTEPGEMADLDDILPDSLFRPLAERKTLPRPLSPSGAGALIDDDDDAKAEGGSRLFGNVKRNAGLSLKVGHAVHRLFQVLPDIEPGMQAAAAARYLARALPASDDAVREALADQVLSTLENRELSILFSPSAQAEVNVMGILNLGGGEFAVSGRIDRMAVENDRILIADFKTNRRAPESESEIAAEHLAQMALYREILKPLYPGKAIACCLIYTTNSRTFMLDEAEMDNVVEKLVMAK
ncbi:double-strand break repair helicase AddA [Rhizobium sp. L1K21]|uniref:double-strand break repair helicase AddA n=1 Tax=Rhizobium sp. L1K21 TaxID=2954933 RepID=UPI0020933383|nr:double-strand break repair helicase AddA [Rhizobium sp. L1K21]MCO6187984.1 double-strand break repair helicase AddA [Rhizobium sp. L1K21]